MMYGLFGRSSIRELMPEEVAEGLAADTILLVDVREPSETARERITGASVAIRSDGFAGSARPHGGVHLCIGRSFDQGRRGRPGGRI